MELLQPYMLWGLLAITLPVIIHFWYQKTGKTINWAASQWLTEKTTWQHRGVRLDEIPLLLIRCLLIVLLVLILSKPIISWLKAGSPQTTIHLVQANRAVADNFRFEIENAKKKKEAVYWIAPEMKEVTDITDIPNVDESELFLQSTIDQLAGGESQFDIYLVNEQKWANLPPVNIPGVYRIFSVADSSKSNLRPYLETSDHKKLWVDDRSSQLTLDNAAASGTRFAEKPVHTGNIQVLIHYKNDAERQTVQAGILALKEVYEIPFVTDMQPVKNNYDWILTDQPVQDFDKKTLYVISGQDMKWAESANVLNVRDSLRLSSSSLVESGEFPEWLGDAFVSWFKLKENRTPLSSQQLHTRFIKSNADYFATGDKSRQWLVLFFVLTFIAERWIALGKTAGRSYG